ncbi:hypothetical protein [Arcobacter peruensis]|uniref:hypothetical protein n=1 Tax=Arcobacter peruensis TaxID=2320140 RepID=UPI0013E01345|nr:hypothetical protein [Arcobacter peruensis]
MNNLQSLKPLATVSSIPTLKPLIERKVSILNIPSQIELILLSTNLLYQSHLILEGKARTTNLNARDYINQAMKLNEILNDYENKYLTNAEVKKIRKDFKLNSLYK